MRAISIVPLVGGSNGGGIDLFDGHPMLVSEGFAILEFGCGIDCDPLALRHLDSYGPPRGLDLHKLPLKDFSVLEMKAYA